MWWRDLPPAGHSIALRKSAVALPQFPGYHLFYVNSGTAALALALMVARARNPAIEHPEVILPGYACPDLVAAAVYAGITPVLADIGAHDPGYDLISLQQALSSSVIAVVAVNFLGISERLPELQQCLRAYPRVLLVEDNAQWFPEPVAGASLTGDAVCLSFGRGKPVSLMGGGAMLLHESLAIDAVVAPLIGPAIPAGRLYLPKVLAYNALLEPNLYGLISRNPWLKLGRTVFKPLSGITEMDGERKALLPTNIERYLQSSQVFQSYMAAVVPSAMDFSASLSLRRGRLLRYPVLCASATQREQLLARLRIGGLGATALYQRILPEIDGVAGRVVVRGSLDGAKAFAQRLLTLPLHASVDKPDLKHMATIFADAVI